MWEMMAKYWAEWAMGIIATMLAIGYRKLSKKIKVTNAENEALKCGMRALLRDRIIQGYNHYMEKGCWPIYAQDSMGDMFKQYKALGGNGTVCNLMEALEGLPVERQMKVG